MIKKKQKTKNKEATVVRDHIRELQRRLLVTFLLLVAAGVASFFYYHQILDILRAPLNQELHYTTPVGSFAFIMRVCLLGGVAVAIPSIIYNILMFIRPAFTKKLSRGSIIVITLFSLTLAAAGVLFSYFVIIPGALHFFGGFAVDGLSAMILADDYLSFVVSALIIFMLMFQLPLIIALIDHMKRLTMKKLFKAERWVILGSLVAALLVPFAMDLSVSLLISLPIILLYNLSILVVAIRHSISKKSKEESVQPTKTVGPETPLTKKPIPIAKPAAAANLANSAAASPVKKPTPAIVKKPAMAPSQTKIQNPVAKTVKSKPARSAQMMDISSYPIDNSMVTTNSNPPIEAALKLESPLPIVRTTPRSAAKLNVPQRESYSAGFEFNQLNQNAELDSETA